MDSLTQLALGAALGEAVLGRRVGYRAALWGGVCATLPDLDVFIPLGDAVADYTFHRSFSHSLLVLPLLSPLLLWLILKLHPQTTACRRGWLALILLTLLTHPLLDSLTVYGTQLLWPLDPTPVGLASVFIIDPLYTLPLLLGVLAARLGRSPARGKRLNLLGLALSTLYLGWGLLAQQQVEALARTQLSLPENHSLLVVPATGSSLLWRVLVMEHAGYQEGFYSLLDRQPGIRFQRYPSEPALLATLQAHWPVARLLWFSKGFYKVGVEDDAIVITDLRMGAEPDYVFRFKVAEHSNPHPTPVTPEQLPLAHGLRQVPDLLRRIWQEPEANPLPPAGSQDG